MIKFFDKQQIRERVKVLFALEVIVIVFLVVCIYIMISNKEHINDLNMNNNYIEDGLSKINNNVTLYAKESNKDCKVDLQQYIYGNNIDVKQKLAELCKTNERAITILQNFDSYPLTLMKGVARNPETLDFAYNFTDKAYGSYSENIDLTQDIKLRNNGVPILIQWDDRWGYASYCDSTIGISGCGPTCLSMVYIALTGDTLYNPLKMARFSEQKGYVVDNIGTSWNLFTQGAKSIGLNSATLSVSEKNIINSLNNGNYIIASMGPGTFTGSGHFIVISGYNGYGFTINDPFNKKFSSRNWIYSEFGDQIKSMWEFSHY